jgi:predicted phage terminase large subunit-like protein
MAETREIRPQPGAQENFLASPADIAIYGGQAGGGKTWGLLLEPLRHVNNPHFGAVIFRRTSPQIRNTGGLWDESLKLYAALGAESHKTTLEWNFPSGASVKFAHLQYDETVNDWQGSQIPLIEFDELTHFSEGQFFYMLSRNRSTCGVRPYVRATCNPDPNSWVAQFISWWIGEDGYPIEARSGRLRWFVRIGNEIEWADSPGELAQYTGAIPKSVTFIRARLEDNPALLEADPGYKANLLALPYVDRMRLLGGNWKVKPSAGKVFNRAWFPIVEAVPAGGVLCRFWDFAATAKKQKGDDPDYTAAVLFYYVNGIWYALDCYAEQIANSDRVMLNLAQQDRERARSLGAALRIRWEIEPGSAGKKEDQRLRRMLAGYDARGKRATGDKLTRSKSLAAQSEVGNVKLLRGDWNERWLKHMHAIPDGEHDDIHDASAGAFTGTLSADQMQSAQIDFYAKEQKPAEATAGERTDGEIERMLLEQEKYL